jgi:hypothetical protein
MYRQTGPSKGNRRAPVAAPGKPRPTAQRGGGGNKAAGSPVPTAESSTVATVSPTGDVHAGPGAVAPSTAEVRELAAKRRAVATKRSVTSIERRKAAVAIASVKATLNKRAAERASAPKPSRFLGRKTAGAPTKSELDMAHESGTLKVDQAGAVTTPSVRQASHHLKRAAAALAAAQPHITGLRNAAQAQFAAELSKKTGIPPKLAGEWVLQESGASAAGAGGEAGEQNELGVGYPAHPTSFSESPYFNNTSPKKAADATAKWMEGKLGSQYDYQAADSIQGIPRLAHGGASEEEIRAYIEGPSAWGTGTIAQSGVSATPGKGARKAAKQLKSAKNEAKSLGLKPKKGSGAVGVKVPYKSFGKAVRLTLRAVTKSKAYHDNSSTAPITIRGPHGSTLVRNVQGSSGVASVIDVNKEPEIAARLLLLSAKTGKTIYINSAYRTDAQAESVGGYAGDPHTKGEAMDIGVDASTVSSADSISEAEYESVGLYRFAPGSATEANHVELLDDGTPATGGYVEGSSEAAPSTGGGSYVPSSSATAVLASSPTGGTAARTAGRAKSRRRGAAKRKLTAEQRYLRNKRKLASIGAPLTSSSKSNSPESHPILEELKAKYGSAPISAKQKAAEAAAA